MNTSSPAVHAQVVPLTFDRRDKPAFHTAPVRESSVSVTSDEFVHAMRHAATSVNVITTDGPAGRFGLTVSAFSSVSAEPAMVLVCINRRSPACAAVRRNRKFCVNVLSAAQRALADTFAGNPATGQPYDFATGSWRGSPTGSPLIVDGVASFDCVLATAIDAGTHTIFIGHVGAVDYTGNRPLLYTNGSYRHLGSKA